MVVGDVHRQNSHGAVIVWLFTFFVRGSNVKICSCVPARSASTFDAGFMIAASAEIGCLVTDVSLAVRSITNTCGEPPVESHTVTNLSLSIAHDPNLMHDDVTPRFGSCVRAPCHAWEDDATHLQNRRQGHREPSSSRHRTLSRFSPTQAKKQ
mmetsp:Transcript_7259/g.23845  ORF Transcript_7259/g.23845 Transcript_7259/m.23845 type:complete len:153 (-) Transcript_7259:98-556(-)